MSTARTRGKMILIAALLGLSLWLGIWKGSTQISLQELFSGDDPILRLRAARVTLALLAGAGLGLCGIALQAVLRNPLAEPFLLGTSSGAGLGAVLSLMLGLSLSLLPLAAFAGALACTILVYFLALEEGRIVIQSLILAGVIISMTFSGLIVFLISLSSNEALRGILWWLLGGLEVYDYRLLWIVAAIVLPGIGVIFLLSHDLNAISLGEEEAIHLGIDAENLKKFLFVLTALITGALVSATGIIGFVGLIVPHIMRLFIGPNHKNLIPATAMGAGAFLVFCDMLARTLVPPVEIPIGVITSLLGAPIFIVLLKRRQKVK